MDLTSPSTIKEITKRFEFAFKKGLGQNFLTSKNVLEDIVEAADISDGVLEIGPGFGVLTYELAKKANKVVAIEIDERLLSVLQYTLGEFDNVEIINADVMKINLSKLILDKFNNKKISVAANLPYYITTPILTTLIESKLPIKNIVVMVQKEVAQRICATEGTKEYGAISVLCQYYAKCEIVRTVPAGLFIPKPKVDSAVLRLELYDKPNICVLDEKTFFKTVKAGFSKRRKTLQNCILGEFNISKDELKNIFERACINPSRRGETLSVKEFGKLSDELFNYISSHTNEK